MTEYEQVVADLVGLTEAQVQEYRELIEAYQRSGYSPRTAAVLLRRSLACE